MTAVRASIRATMDERVASTSGANDVAHVSGVMFGRYARYGATPPWERRRSDDVEEDA